MQIITKRERVEQVSYNHVFALIEHEGSFYSFPCTEKGEVIDAEMNPAAWENYRKCLMGEHKVVDKGVEKWVNRYTIPARGKCVCGNELCLGSFTNTCHKCQRDYNMSGQLLAHRSQWGEETGETASDILNYDYEAMPDIEY